MGKTNNSLGKSVAHHLGYNIRMMVTSKPNAKTKKPMKQHTGKFGVYAGKNKIEEVDDIASALAKIDKIVSDKKPKQKTL